MTLCSRSAGFGIISDNGSKSRNNIEKYLKIFRKREK
jgi:hypothetical protein